jgi:hypothetical protein
MKIAVLIALVPSVIWGEAAHNYKPAIGATPVQQCRTHLTVVESGVGVRQRQCRRGICCPSVRSPGA